MSKIDLVQNLRQILVCLKDITDELDKDLSELTRCIHGMEFIPDTLGERVTGKLTQIETMQEELKSEFVSLEIGELPSEITKFNDLLEQYQKNTEVMESYLEAVKFFMTLQSEDNDIQTLLNDRKKYLSSLDFNSMSAKKLKEISGIYVLLYNAFNETDDKKKFSLVYKLAGNIEESIAMGVQFGTIKSIDVSEGSKAEVIQNDIIGKNKEQVVSDEEINKDKKAVEDKLEDVSAIETIENIWTMLEIEDVSAVIFEENKELLKVELSSRVTDKFGVSKFKNDITKHLPDEKIICLVEALEKCGYSRESIALWKNKERGYYDFATDKLFQYGYLKRFFVDGFGEFYTLSSRGEKAFMSKESLAFINKLILLSKNGVNTVL